MNQVEYERIEGLPGQVKHRDTAAHQAVQESLN